MRRKTITLLKLALSLALLAAIVAYSGPREVLAALRGVNPALIALAFALLLGDALVRTFNWFQLLHHAGCKLQLGTVAHAYFAGGFVGALLPSTLGTDLARSAFAAQGTRTPLELPFATTVLQNALSLAVIGAAGLCASLALLTAPDAPRAALMAGAGVSAACVLVIALLWAGSRRPRKAVEARAGWSAPLRRRLERFRAALVFQPAPRAAAGIGAVALLCYGLRTLGWLTLLASAGAEVPWAVLLAIGPLVTIGAALPISVLGFGGFQAIHVTLLGLWGVPAEQALAASLLQSGLSVLLYGIGCVAYVAGGRKPIMPGAPEPRGVS